MGKTIKSLRRNPDAPLWRDVLKSIKAKPKLAFYFAKPVDHVALNIPLYPTIVKSPMDLQTIERKLAANEYAELDDFATDVRLVFSNAMLFNKNEQHQVHIAARSGHAGLVEHLVAAWKAEATMGTRARVKRWAGTTWGKTRSWGSKLGSRLKDVGSD